jgi:glucose dehydrogenase
VARSSAGRRSGRAADLQIAENGKEYVVISAGGASHSPDVGDDIIAYALEE